MMEMNFFLWLSSVLIVIQNFDLSRGILEEKWIEQYQDHFDNYNDETWLMRYYKNNQFYRQSGPIFILIGGEDAITADGVGDTYFMYELARAYEAMMYSTEHRYYGKSHPVPNTSFENLKYLTISQVLADIAFFIEAMKKELNNSNAFVMVFGGSYAGNLAAWMRVKYPNLVHAALADSAPIHLKADFFEFYEFVEKSIRNYDENCTINIKKAFSAVEELLKSPAINTIKLKNDFRLWNPDFSQHSEIPNLMFTLATMFSQALMYNMIENICISMRRNEAMSPYYRLAEVFKEKYSNDYSPIDAKYNAIEEDRQTSWESGRVGGRLWMYQSCTELGYHRKLWRPNSIFGSLVPEEYFDDLCRDTFTPDFDVDSVKLNIKNTNLLYNSQLPNTKHIIFTNGVFDPWSSISVLSALNADSPAFLIDDASHCDFITEHETTTQTNSLIAARCQVTFMIHEWVMKYRNSCG